MTSEAARQKYPDVGLVYAVDKLRAAYDAGRADALRELADDLHPTRMWVPTIGLLNERAAQIEKEARG